MTQKKGNEGMSSQKKNVSKASMKQLTSRHDSLPTLLHAVLFSYERTLANMYGEKAPLVVPYILEELEKVLPANIFDQMDSKSSVDSNMKTFSDYLSSGNYFGAIRFRSMGVGSYTVEVSECMFAKQGVHGLLKSSGNICPVALLHAAFLMRLIGKRHYVAVSPSEYDDDSSITYLNVKKGEIAKKAEPPVADQEIFSFPLDRVDIELLRMIQENARMSNVEIADALGTSEATIRRRVQSLIDRGVIRGFITQIDHAKFRPKVRVNIAIDASLDKIDEVAKKLLSRPELCSLYRSIGKYNLVCEILMDDMTSIQDLVDELSNTQGVNKIDSMITTSPLKVCPWYGI